MLTNLNFIPRLLGTEVQCHDIWHGSNKAAPSYLSWAAPEEYWAFWDDSELQRARNLWARLFRDVKYFYGKRQLLQREILPFFLLSHLFISNLFGTMTHLQ